MTGGLFDKDAGRKERSDPCRGQHSRAPTGRDEKREEKNVSGVL